jgi:glycosyltransferase involved in cell wall biosynthesis
VVGFVSDIRSHVLEASVFVVPLRIGGGTRIKILEAMSMGKSVVSTSVGAEGLEVEEGTEILLADDPESFAARVLELFENGELRKRLGHAARERVVHAYDWRIIGRKLAALLERL